jgi:glycosyltransferase involved in cell wall biosynthesis
MLNIIIPTYNNEDLLEQALLSLKLQTKKMFIVTIIDDCSKNSDSIKDTIKKFNTLNIIYSRNEKNLGPGLSRQAGINIAYEKNFDYVMFMDQDDILYPRAIELLYYEAKKNNADVVSSNIFSEGTIYNNLIDEGNNLTWVHGKIYKVSFLKEKNIEFSDKILYNEDSYFNLICKLLSSRYFYVNETTYLWRNNKKSVTRNGSNDSIFNYQYCLSQIYALDKALNSECNPKSEFSSTFCNIYNAYEIEKVIYKEHLDLLETEIKKFLSSDKLFNYYNDNILNRRFLLTRIKEYAEIKGKPVLFPDTFLNWLNNMGLERIGKLFNGE